MPETYSSEELRIIRQVIVDLLRAADGLKRHLNRVLEGHGITFQQYNVLRILRGADKEGLPTLAIAERMMEQTPGITRLIDRLEKKGLVTRRRHRDDRRRVLCRVTNAGLQLLKRLDDPMDQADYETLAHLTKGELERLHRLLSKLS